MSLIPLITSFFCLVSAQPERLAVKIESQALLQSAFNRRKKEGGGEAGEGGFDSGFFCQRGADTSNECIDASSSASVRIVAESDPQLIQKAETIHHMHGVDDGTHQIDSIATSQCRILLGVLTLVLCMRCFWALCRHFADRKPCTTETFGAESVQCEPLRAVDTWGLTPLHKAANAGLDTEVEMLINDGFEIDAMDVCSATPLHLAARGGHSDVCDILCKHGASVNAKNVDQLTPLLMAGRGGHEDTCKVLFGHGGDTDNLAIDSLPIVLRELMVSSSPIDSN